MKTLSDSAKKALKIANELFLMIALAMVLYNLVNASGFSVVVSVALLLAILSAAIYYLFGSKKDAAKYYLYFIGLYALSRLIQVISAAMAGNIVGAVASAFSFGALCVLLEAKDLGVRKTQAIGLLILIASLIPLITTIASGQGVIWLFISITDVILAVVINVMILAKYEDKTERGTK